MRKAYIILAHHNEGQLYRLLERLNDGCSFFFLHIDKKASQEFEMVVNAFKNSIKLIDSVPIEWGGFGLVEATLKGMQAIKSHPGTFQWIILISGQDYPIKTNYFINQFLCSTTASAFFEYTVLPDYKRWSPRGGYYRLDKYFMGFKNLSKITAKALNFLSEFIPYLRRPVLRNIKPFAGSQWWIMNIETMLYVLDYVERNPGYYAFHKYSFASDEIFFHSIVMNAPEEFSGNVENNNKRFYMWPDTSKSHPEILEEKDFPVIEKSDALFARKFDMNQDARIMDLIDEHCLKVKYAAP